MSDLWYWRSNDRLRGPLVTEELEAIVLNQRLADSDSVRLDGTEEWISAADIRRMFLQSTGSPAETAARLLETAAARRLQATASTQGPTGAGGFVGRLSGLLGDLATSFAELVSRGFHASTAWLGLRGRLLVTAIAGLAVLVVLASWMISLWGPRDSGRLAQVDDVWKAVQASASANSPLPPEVSERLDTLEKDLDASLRDEPVSGSTGSDRQSSLARREMLYAVRAMRESQADLDDPTRARIDLSLNAASDFLSGYSVSPDQPTPAANPQGRWSGEIVAILAFDAVLAVVVAGWWLITRGRG